MKKSISIVILFLLLCCSKEDKPQELAIEQVNFYGCATLKSVVCKIQYQVLPDNHLKIIRQGEILNCGTDSVILEMSCKGNLIKIQEIQGITSPAFCDCNMSYEYVIGPLEFPDYEFKITAPGGTAYEFVVVKDDKTLKSACE